MTLFELVKQVVRVPEAAAYYGLQVSRNGMACCPFHDDRHPSMKLNERCFYCFGCGATGDVIDLVAKLFGLSLTPEAVELLHLEHAKHPISPLMFMHPATQKPYSPQMVRRMHNEIIKEAGLDHIRFADLRHTCAVLSLQNGMGTKEVSQMLCKSVWIAVQRKCCYLSHQQQILVLFHLS